MAEDGGPQRVIIEVLGQQSDVLKRIALLHAAFVRILTGSRLVEVVEADYNLGRMEFLVEDGRVRPRVEGAVSVRYLAAN